MYYDLSLGLSIARLSRQSLIIGLKDLVHCKKVWILENGKEVLIFNFFVQYFLFHNRVMLRK